VRFLCHSTAFLYAPATVQMLKLHTVRWFSRLWCMSWYQAKETTYRLIVQYPNTVPYPSLLSYGSGSPRCWSEQTPTEGLTEPFGSPRLTCSKWSLYDLISLRFLLLKFVYRTDISGISNNYFIEHFPLSVTIKKFVKPLKEFLKSVNIWWRYG